MSKSGMNSGAFALALACMPPLAQAAPAGAGQADAPARYTHTMELAFSGKESLVQLRLPKEIYQSARATDLADLRVFDRDGKPVPFAFLDRGSQALVSVKSTPVSIFPVMAEAEGKHQPSLDIRTSADGTLVSVNARSQNGRAVGNSKLAALVLDTRAEEAAGAPPTEIASLRLTLPPNVDNYTARIRLEVSDDLKQWENLGESVVSWMTNADTKALSSDRIEFDAQAFRYARLSWREGTPLLFSKVLAERHSRSDAARVVDSMILAPQPGRSGSDIVYRAAPAIPVHSFGLQFIDANVVVPALVGRYVELPAVKQGQSKRWDFQPAFRATFFRLTQGGKIRTSGDVAIGDSHVGEWVVRPSVELSPAPSVRISWQPASIVFLTGGKKPYSLAIGRDAAPGAAVRQSSVAPGFGAAELSALEHATVGAIRQQSAARPAMSEANVAGISARGRTAVLWGALLVGVLALALMVRHLVKQMPG
ncbi:DUF3999 family protein [Massilia sp. TWR1-2-2]|uniref:DUF3999 family protein n=1 Tax=Massilia sp. TWR1-2-2 TaxID=2804584 RepID=UPI003CF51D4D